MHRKYAQNALRLIDAAADPTMPTPKPATNTANNAGTRPAPEPAGETTWDSLEQRVDELIELTAVLAKENRALKVQQQHWSTERAKLIEKNELAKSRVEAMISRLKSLEQD